MGKKLHSEEIHSLYSSPCISRMINSMRMRFAGHIARMEEMRNAYKILVGKPEEKRPFRRPNRRGVIILKLILGKGGWRV
jgi:hypothetical protein